VFAAGVFLVGVGPAFGGTRPCEQAASSNFQVIGGAPRDDKSSATAEVNQLEKTGSIITLGNQRPETETVVTEANCSENSGPTALTGQRKVRVVGPVFFPDPEEAIDLQAPAPREVP
jgi:hypothetical protein